MKNYISLEEKVKSLLRLEKEWFKAAAIQAETEERKRAISAENS